MPITAQWFTFTESVVNYDRDDAGVYELGNAAEIVVYVGSSNELKRRLKEHLNEAGYTCIKQNANRYRIEYTANYKKRELELYDAHVAAHGRAPQCNDARPSGD
jgi:predicted GIY-YIG superfamily endonuclease